MPKALPPGLRIPGRLWVYYILPIIVDILEYLAILRVDKSFQGILLPFISTEQHGSDDIASHGYFFGN